MTELVLDTPAWMEPLLKPARYKGAHGGRGSGKSHGFAEMLIEEHIANPNDSSVCIREVQKTLNQSVKRLLEAKIQSMNAGWYFDVLDAQIRSTQGSGLVIFQGMQNHTADSIKSLEGYKRAWVEEAQTLSQRSLDLLRPTIRMPGSELWFTWNPRFDTDPVDVLLRGENPPPDACVVEVNWSDNPWFPDVLRQEMEYDRGRDVDKYLHVWEGGYDTKSNARVFKNWRIEEFEIPNGQAMKQGADWGFSVDPSVLVQCWIEGRNLYVPYEAYMVGCEIDNLPELFDRVPDSRKWFTTADSARPETISYMQRHGYPRMGAAIKGANSLEEGIQFLQSFDIVVHPRCVHTIDELTHYAYKTDPDTGEVLGVLEDRNNHVIDAIRYACEGARRAAGVQQKLPAIKRRFVV
jgi:phage terminase large subunit